MNLQSYTCSAVVGVGLLLGQLVSLPGLSIRAEASSPNQTSSQVTSRSPRVVFRPPRSNAPRSTVSGGTRNAGICSQSLVPPQPGFTPVLPNNQTGLTVAERPTFIAYVPPTTTRTVFFSLKGEDDDYYYQTTFSLEADGSIVSFALPAEAPPLQIGKSYRWSFVLVCSARLRPDDPRIEGWVTRTELSQPLVSQLEQESLLERAVTYGDAGIWVDMMATLVDLRRADPGNLELTQLWQEMLSEHGLGAIASAPLR